MNERERLLKALEQGRSRLAAAVKAVPDGAWSQGVYENGWNAKNCCVTSLAELRPGS